MKKLLAQLLAICLLLLTGNGLGIAQESRSADQAKSVAAQEKEAAEKEKNRAANETRVAARAVAQEKRDQERVKREVERQKLAAKRQAAEQKRSLREATRQAAHPDGIFKLLGPKGPGMGKVVKGAPYSATATTEHTQTLSDGNQIIQKNEATYYRDSEGRTRIDQKLKTIGKWTAEGDPPRVITIFDPVVGNYYSLDPRTRIALMDVRGPQKGPAGPRDLNGPKGPSDLKAPKPPIAPKGLNGPRDLNGPKDLGPKPDQKEKKKESLGTRTIEGVSADGSRSTVIIPAGEIGNVAPIEITDESWYSPELQLPVMTRHHDPRSGDTTYKLTNINRSEPARSLFEVPADYRVVDKRAPGWTPKPEPKPVPKPAEPGKKIEIDL